MADYAKTETAVLDFVFDWTLYLAGVDTIISSDWDIPTGISGTAPVTTTTTTGLRVFGGTLGQYYVFVNTIVMASGQVDQRPLIISIISVS